MAEEIVLLNDDWQVIGRAPKAASHNESTPLHLAFSCYVLNDEGKVLISRRAFTKKTWPGVWSNSFCGHPEPDESLEAAVRRRADYELGLELTDIECVLPRFRYRAKFHGIVENECCPVFVAHANANPRLNPREVADYKWLTWPEVMAEISAKHPMYSYWCRKQIPLLYKKGIALLDD